MIVRKNQRKISKHVIAPSTATVPPSSHSEHPTAPGQNFPTKTGKTRKIRKTQNKTHEKVDVTS